MSARLANRFLKERAAGRKLFVPFLTAGDRGLSFTRRAVLRLAELGADAIELGVPFSDPLADGKAIQASSQRALQRGATLTGILQLIKQLRRETNVPLLLMGYLNPFLHPSSAQNIKAAAAAGADGFIVPDLPPEEAGAWIRQCRARDVDTIFLATPTSTPQRLRAIARLSTGYIYYVSVTGTTGTRQHLPADLQAAVGRIRQVSPLPVLIGFGISNPEQARRTASAADGVIVGSALVNTLAGRVTDAQALGKMTQLAGALIKAVKKR